MTAFDQFDPVDLRVASALEDLAAATRPDYITDVLKVTASRRQRPRWTFLERLLPMDTTMRRPIGLRTLPIRPLILLLLLLLAAVGAALYAGSRPVLAPFGPAANGQILYIADGDLYVRDSLEDAGRLLVSVPGDEIAPTWSPDGQWIGFVSSGDDGDQMMVARADGTDVHAIASIPKTGNAQAAWRPDSRAMGLIYLVKGSPQLSVAFVDGSPAQVFDFGYDQPTELAWRPPNGGELLVRVLKPFAKIDYATIRFDGTNRRDLGLPSERMMGPNWYNPAAAWSPDGSRIAYTQVVQGGTRAGGPFETHVVNADGTGDLRLPLSADPSINENWPVFSPDGKSILINRWTYGDGDAPGKAWLAIMPADGSAPARDIGRKFTAANEIQLAKSWSPDGSRVVVYQGEDGGAYSIDPTTGEQQPLSWTTDLPDTQRVLR